MDFSTLGLLSVCLTHLDGSFLYIFVGKHQICVLNKDTLSFISLSLLRAFGVSLIQIGTLA